MTVTSDSASQDKQGTLQLCKVSIQQDLSRTVLLHHMNCAPESHAVGVHLDALLVPLVPRVFLSVQSRNNGTFWVACRPAQMRLLVVSAKREVLIGALLQNLKSGSQAQPLFLFCPAAAGRCSYSNRDQAGITSYRVCHMQSCSMTAGCLAISAMVVSICSISEPTHTCSCHAATPIRLSTWGCCTRRSASHQ